MREAVIVDRAGASARRVRSGPDDRVIHHMRAHGLRYGPQTMCEGAGTANATLVELAS